MPNSIIQEFLNQKFITPDQESHVASLEKAAGEIEKRLRAKKARIPQAVQLAFDPQALEQEALFVEIQNVIIAKGWTTFAGKNEDKPTTYIRAVLLAAIQNLIAEPQLAGIVCLTARNYFSYTVRGSHAEASLLKKLLSEATDHFETAGWDSWSVNQVYQFPQLPPITAVGLTKVSKYKTENLARQLATAAAANGETLFTVSGNYITNGNVVASTDWAVEFGKPASEAIASFIGNTTDDINKVLADAASSAQLQEYIKIIAEYLKNITTNLANQTASHNLRSRLLWIKESQYSLSQRSSYRVIHQAARPVVIAYDAANEVPEIYPASVEHFLRETLAVTDKLADEQLTFEALLKELADGLSPHFLTSSPPESGRRSLLEFISDNKQSSELEGLTGLPVTDTLTRADFAVWIFRELQVQKLVSTK